MSDSQKGSVDVANYWDKHVGEHLDSFAHWECNAPVMEHQNFRVSGARNVTALSWFWAKYGPFRSMASIGSGSGILEKCVGTWKDPGASVVGYDISPGSLKIAAKNCSELQNVSFDVANMNTKVWPQNCFDVVFAHGALHHVESLDWCLGQIRRGLQQDGLLYVNDYVGPERFQWSDVQIRLSNELIKSTIPSKWVKNGKVSRTERNALIKLDPSEAVCSHFIEDTIAAHFHVIERIPRGGTLLAPIFGSGCLDISILKSVEGLECLAELAEKESELIDIGMIRADHVVIVARKRSGEG